MAYRTILTVVTDLEAAGDQIAAAAALARRFDAHLDILCLGIDAVQVGYYFAGADMMLQETSLAAGRERAQALLERAEARAQAEDVRYTAQALVAQIGLVADVVGQAARFADLVMLPRPQSAEAPSDAEAVLEAALFTGSAPVLLVPDSGLPAGFPRRAVIGWNEGSEALRAVRAALPALQVAERAVVAIVDPPMRAPDQAPPGERLSTLLDRHGVAAEIALMPRDRPRVSDILMAKVADAGADLLVAGAYGHSRFREAVLGGATRELLQKAAVPLLMAH